MVFCLKLLFGLCPSKTTTFRKLILLLSSGDQDKNEKHALLSPLVELLSNHGPKECFLSYYVPLKMKINQFLKCSGFNKFRWWTKSKIIVLYNVSHHSQKALNLVYNLPKSWNHEYNHMEHSSGDWLEMGFKLHFW
jgi:hypothetical protein